MSDRMNVPQELRDLAISETGFVFDPHTGSTFSVNEAGLELLEGLRRGCTTSELIERLRAHFEVPEGTDLERDVAEFVARLARNEIVPEGFKP